MSCPHVVWALRQRGMSAAERVVLIYLADKANGAMVCWPSISTIAQAVELSCRTVQSAVHKLAALALIRIDTRHRRVHYYHIQRPPGDNGPVEPSSSNGVDHNPAPKVIHRPQPRICAKSADKQPEVCAESAAQINEPPILPAKSAQNGSFLPANFAHHPPKKESPKKSAQGFSDSREEASKPAKEARLPTVAEIEAQRRAYAASLEGMPGEIAAALSKLGRQVRGVSYAPGQKPRRDAEEQIELLNVRPMVKARPLTREQLTAAYRATLIRPAAAYVGASP